MNVFPVLQNTAVLSCAILITLVSMMLHIHFVKVDHESLLVIGSLGIQVSSSYASGRETTTFIEMNKIKDIVINEAIYMVRQKAPKVIFCNVSSRISHLMFLILQQQIIYYLCVLLKDPSDPDAASSIVPLFQVRLTHLQSAVLRVLHFSHLQRTVFSCTTFPCLSEFQAKAGLFGEGLQKLPGDSFKQLITTE